MKCSNGKWKYGENGNCVFDTLQVCRAAAAAIHIEDEDAPAYRSESTMTMEDVYRTANKQNK
jgi:hypothetical protein